MCAVSTLPGSAGGQRTNTGHAELEVKRCPLCTPYTDSMHVHVIVIVIRAHPKWDIFQTRFPSLVFPSRMAPPRPTRDTEACAGESEGQTSSGFRVCKHGRGAYVSVLASAPPFPGSLNESGPKMSILVICSARFIIQDLEKKKKGAEGWHLIPPLALSVLPCFVSGT